MGRATERMQIRPEDLEDTFRPNAPAKLAHIVLKTPRMDAMIAWYTTVLDAVLVFRDKRVAFLTYDNEHHRVALIAVPSFLRLPARFWALHRKVFGVDHIAFTYAGLDDLMRTYRRLADVGIRPVWTINHGPTISMYYEDPDGTRLELQIDVFETNQDLLDWINGGEFDDNPIGTEFDPDVLERELQSGTSVAELTQRGAAPPPHRPARVGMRNITWRTL